MVHRECDPVGLKEAGTMVADAKGTVLVVDDEGTIRKFVVDVLEQAGHTALEAGDGSEAVEVFRVRQEEIDLVLLDLGKPGMSGYEAMAQMQVLDPDVRIAIITGLTPDADRLPGVQTILTKPFSVGDVLQLVGGALEG